MQTAPLNMQKKGDLPSSSREPRVRKYFLYLMTKRKFMVLRKSVARWELFCNNP